MRRRCNKETDRSFKDYGGRGITVCKEWDKFEAFQKWSIENGYNDNLSIDRIDTNGNYEPSNCRWTDWETQAGNRRKPEKVKNQYGVWDYKTAVGGTK